jgi:hypothetical protein
LRNCGALVQPGSSVGLIAARRGIAGIWRVARRWPWCINWLRTATRNSWRFEAESMFFQRMSRRETYRTTLFRARSVPLFHKQEPISCPPR